MYQKPVVLNSEAHRNVKLAPVTSYSFGGNMNAVILAGQEILEAAKDYPVVFAKNEDEEISLLAILGLRTGQNLFVDDEGKWENDRYIPAFFRRYPFIVTELPGAAEGQLSVCVDSGYEGFDSDEGMQLFDEEGEQTEDMKRADIQFLTDFQNQFQRTRAMIKLLQDYELFKDVSANITLPGGEKIGFGNLQMVDEQAMLKLDDEKILTLVRSGALAWIYAHLVSISNFRDLMSHAAKAEGAEGEGAEGEGAEGEGGEGEGAKEEKTPAKKSKKKGDDKGEDKTFGDLMEEEGDK